LYTYYGFFEDIINMANIDPCHLFPVSVRRLRMLACRTLARICNRAIYLTVKISIREIYFRYRDGTSVSVKKS
jgi:hypothetical protein